MRQKARIAVHRSSRWLAVAFIVGACGTQPVASTATPAGLSQSPPSMATAASSPVPSIPGGGATPCVPPNTAILQSPPVAKPTEPSGRTDVEWPYSEGFIYVRLAACRDISAISARYGLQGPALRLNSGPYDPIALAIGIDRSYHVPVRVGDEMREVERLAAHPADFDFVSLIGASTWVCVVTCPPSPTVVPAVGPRGTAFTLRFCCWPEGTAVEKIFTTPDGRSIRLRDTSREDGTVPAAWGSGPDDVVGTYVVKVHGEGVAEVLRFRIE